MVGTNISKIKNKKKNHKHKSKGQQIKKNKGKQIKKKRKQMNKSKRKLMNKSKRKQMNKSKRKQIKKIQIQQKSNKTRINLKPKKHPRRRNECVFFMFLNLNHVFSNKLLGIIIISSLKL